MCVPDGGSSGADDAAAQARADEAARQARIKTGRASIDTAFQPFNDQFYTQRGKDYLDWATPQIDQQYKNAHDQLVYSLARSSLLDSSVANKKFANLDKENNDARLSAADQADQTMKDTRSSVENARANLYNENEAAADPSAASSLALGQAKVLSAANAYSPIGQLFQNATQGLANTVGGPANGYNGLLGGRLYGNNSYVPAAAPAATIHNY